MTKLVHLFAACAALLAAPVSAGPITATRDGWITLHDLDALGEIVWTMDADVPFYLFHDNEAVYDNSFDNEQSSYTVNIVDGRKYVHLFASALSPRCGRWQADAGLNLAAPDKHLGIIDEWDNGILNSCIDYPPNDAPPDFIPPFSPPLAPPDDTVPDVPEPASMLMVGSGLLWLARKKKS